MLIAIMFIGDKIIRHNPKTNLNLFIPIYGILCTCGVILVYEMMKGLILSLTVLYLDYHKCVS